MSQISLDADQSLAGALRASGFQEPLYLVLRTGEGKVRWSGVLNKWTVNDRSDMTVDFVPVEQQIDNLVEFHRAALQADAISKGLL